MVRDHTTSLLRAIEYDRARRRLWLFGQRCHHGATGAVLTSAAVVGGLAAARVSRPLTVVLAATGSLMMVHDWKDRTMWFERGRGTQP